VTLRAVLDSEEHAPVHREADTFQTLPIAPTANVRGGSSTRIWNRFVRRRHELVDAEHRPGGRCGDLDVAHLGEAGHRDEEVERAHDWSARMSIAPAP
jgi:hypothetical protein